MWTLLWIAVDGSGKFYQSISRLQEKLGIDLVLSSSKRGQHADHIADHRAPRSEAKAGLEGTLGMHAMCCQDPGNGETPRQCRPKRFSA